MESHFDGAFDGSLPDAEANLKPAGPISDQGQPTGQKQHQIHLFLSPQSLSVDASLFSPKVKVLHGGASHCGTLDSAFRSAVRRALTSAPPRPCRPTTPSLKVPLWCDLDRLLDRPSESNSTARLLEFREAEALLSTTPTDHPCSTRPRLNQEQTAYLEEQFQDRHTPSRSDKDRMAIRLGISSRKVDNRRAKERHPPKHIRQDLGELALCIPDSFQSHIKQVTAMDSLHPAASQRSYTMAQSQILPSSDANFEAVRDWAPESTMELNAAVDSDAILQQFLLGSEHSAQSMDLYLAGGHQVQDLDLSSSSSTIQDSPLNNQAETTPSTTGYRDHDASNNLDLYANSRQVQASAAHQDDSQYFAQFRGESSASLVPSGQHFNADQLAHLNAPFQGYTPQDALAYQRSLSHQSLSNACSRSGSRRGSFKSEIPLSFDTAESLKAAQSNIHQQAVNGVFKTPDVPTLSLAARRKHKRPPVLSTRTFSASAAQDPSSPQHAAPSLPSGAVRRIKSMGNPLNVISGRVQKVSQHSTAMTLRSPIGSVPEHTSLGGRSPPFTAPMSAPTNEVVTEQFASVVPSADLSAFAFPYNQHQQRQPPASAGILESQTFESFIPSPSSVPPLSAAPTMDSYADQQWARSPPYTPFGHQNEATYGGITDFMGSYYDHLASAQHVIPQSAPAHTTEFMLHNSPPNSAHPLTPGTQHVFFPPTVPSQHRLQSHHIQHHLRSQQRPRRLQIQTLHGEQVDPVYYAPPTSAHAAFDLDTTLASQPMPQHFSHTRILRAESGADRTATSMASHFNSFFASPQPPPEKELEIIEAQFPRPKTLPLQLGRNGIPHEFQFQNSGPEDFNSTANE